jgi:endonuclease/exonuclease/phosphatase family metal-dependent hydrolase
MIVMGDFNEQWGSPDSVVRQLVEAGGLLTHEPDSAEFNTYKTKRLDWILVSPQLEFVDYHVVEHEISDHRLVVAELRWRDDP